MDEGGHGLVRDFKFRLNDFVITSLGEAYPQLHQQVMRHGYRVDSRLGPSMNLKNVTIALLDPARTIVKRKGMSVRFAAEEATQILAGVYDHDRLAAVNKNAAKLITPKTAYGPRIWPQLNRVEQELRDSAATRRATVYIGRHDDLDRSDDVDRAAEMPCTKTWQFDLTEGRLDMTAEMRSNDLVWGLSYDIPCFTAVQRAMARALGVEVGVYWHKANSLHVYEKHYQLETEPLSDDGFLNLDTLFRPTMMETKHAAGRALK
jgi:thymidylate synthase